MAMTPQQHEDAMYQRAVTAVRKAGATSVAHLQQECRLSYNGAVEFLERMQREGIIGPAGEDGTWSVLTP